jgi:hypothetical protein
MFSFDGSTITVNSTSGLARLKYGWGTGTVDPFYAALTAGTYYKIVNRNSGKAVDVNGGSTNN